MKIYCVVQEYYDSGRVSAWITNHIMDELPGEKLEERSDKDVWLTYFTNKKDAIEFCDEALKA